VVKSREAGPQAREVLLSSKVGDVAAKRRLYPCLEVIGTNEIHFIIILAQETLRHIVDHGNVKRMLIIFIVYRFLFYTPGAIVYNTGCIGVLNAPVVAEYERAFRERKTAGAATNSYSVYIRDAPGANDTFVVRFEKIFAARRDEYERKNNEG
jgi:hypothetical protein